MIHAKTKIMMLLLVVSIFVGAVYAAPIEEWNRTYAPSCLGECYWSAANSVQQTTDGGYVLAGEMYLYVSDVESRYDGFLLKTDNRGNRRWSRTYPYDPIYSVRQTVSGNYILAGAFDEDPVKSAILALSDGSGNVLWNKNFDNIRGAVSAQQTADGGYIFAGDIYPLADSSDISLVKTDVNGNKVWNKTFGGSNPDSVKSVQQTKDRGYIMTGYTHSYGKGSNDVLLIKTDSNGNQLWKKTFEKMGWEWAFSVRQTQDGGYIIAGNTNPPVNEYAFLIKTDGNGNKVWEKIFGNGYDSIFLSAQQTTDGGYIATGHIGTSDTHTRYAWLVKTDANGNKLWEKKLSGDTGNSVKQTTDGGYIVAGDKNTNTWIAKISPYVNLLRNPGFETVNGSLPQYWSKFQTGTKARFTFPTTGRVGGKSVTIRYPVREVGKVALWQQTEIVVSPGKQYELSGYMKLEGVTGGRVLPGLNGAGIRVSWYTSAGVLIRTDVTTKSGKIGWAKYGNVFISPPNAAKATVGGYIYNAAGNVTFDDMSFVKVS